MNRLQNEASPYLKQHAQQPVWWYPWGEAAFQKAETEQKPVFLSIGYSTCHWCHVMAEESFEDETVADILNTHFIAIKVDREERPDIDSIYMEACQAVTGSGGWPLSIFLKPDKQPFFAGTYFPREDKNGRAGFKTLLLHIAGLWQNQPEAVDEAAGDILSFLAPQPKKQESLQDLSQDVFLQFEQSFDAEYGGLRGSIKFPMPQNIFFLLRYYKRFGGEAALFMAEKTLQSMYMGGIYDHVGGGFCRYATDNKWQIPHFEKMLYDNALLAAAYTECWQATKNPLYKQVVEGIFGYMNETLQDENGMYYTAQDADSEGEEGKYYAFSKAELDTVLGNGKTDFAEAFPYSQEGNFEGRNVLYRVGHQHCSTQLARLKAYRDKRIPPGIDTKVIAATNGMALAAFSKAARAFCSSSYKKQAETLAAALSAMKDEKGRLLRLSGSKLPAFAEDYAYVIWGQLEVYQLTGDGNYLQEAADLAKQYHTLFWDDKEFGFYLSGNDAERLVKNPKEAYDNAYPSYNSMSAQCFMTLFQLTGDRFYQDAAEKTLLFLFDSFKNAPLGSLYTAAAVLSYFSDNLLVHAAGGEDLPGWAEITGWLDESFLPFCQLRRGSKEYRPVDGKTTLYICDSNSCKPPENDLEQIKKLL